MSGLDEVPSGEFLDGAAADLDSAADVPDDVLSDVVTRDGACMALYQHGSAPDWSDDELTDRDIAAQICAGCPVRRECLELELRTSGDAMLGVWGALPADEVRALYPVWRSRRQQRDESGGPRRGEGGELA